MAGKKKFTCRKCGHQDTNWAKLQSHLWDHRREKVDDKPVAHRPVKSSDVNFCPSCGYHLNVIPQPVNFCPGCGFHVSLIAQAARIHSTIRGSNNDR